MTFEDHSEKILGLSFHEIMELKQAHEIRDPRNYLKLYSESQAEIAYLKGQLEKAEACKTAALEKLHKLGSTT